MNRREGEKGERDKRMKGRRDGRGLFRSARES
jgi:hypothetical protein